MGTSDEKETKRGRPNKVASLIEQYNLELIGDELEAAWTKQGDDHKSLRYLADYFNKQLLREELRDAGLQTLDQEPANLYRLLTADDVSRAEQTRAQRKLDREGIDVDNLVKNFVSYQSIRNYLQNCRGAEYTHGDGTRIDVATKNIQRLRGRTATVTEHKLDQLKESGTLNLGEFRTIVDVSVVCENCGTQHEISELLEEGNCDCRT